MKTSDRIRQKLEPELKSKALEDYLKTGNAQAVGKKYGVSADSLYNWKHELKLKNADITVFSEKQKLKKLEHTLAEKELEIEILRDLLKKTYQVMPISLK